MNAVAHFGTAPGWPQTEAEVDAASDDVLAAFAAMCPVAPADPGCLACYAFVVAAKREDYADVFVHLAMAGADAPTGTGRVTVNLPPRLAQVIEAAAMIRGESRSAIAVDLMASAIAVKLRHIAEIMVAVGGPDDEPRGKAREGKPVH